MIRLVVYEGEDILLDINNGPNDNILVPGPDEYEPVLEILEVATELVANTIGRDRAINELEFKPLRPKHKLYAVTGGKDD